MFEIWFSQFWGSLFWNLGILKQNGFTEICTTRLETLYVHMYVPHYFQFHLRKKIFRQIIFSCSILERCCFHEILLNSANVNHWTGVENMTSEYLPKYVLTYLRVTWCIRIVYLNRHKLPLKSYPCQLKVIPYHIVLCVQWK